MLRGMVRGSKAGGFVLALLALVGIAYTPLVGGGHRGEDLALLIRAAELPGFRLEALYRVDGEGSALANLLAAIHVRAHGFDRALWLRLEGIGLLLLAACGLGLFLRRLLLPWTGREHAAAAGLAVVPLLAAHPLAGGLVADLGARDELLALTFATWSGAFFLWGRQDRVFRCTVISAVLCALAGAAGELGLLLPVVLVVAELTSSHRYRVLRERLRTGANTLLFFGFAASVDLLLRAGRTSEGLAPGIVEGVLACNGPEGIASVVEGVGRKLGMLVLPVNPAVGKTGGLVGTVLALVVLLAAIQPALVAARAAPRLWGWILGLGFVGLLLGLLPALAVDVRPDFPTHAGVLAGSCAVVAAGLALASTSLSGPRRTLLPWGAAFVYAALAHGNAGPWREAADTVADLRADLELAREIYGADTQLMVLDAPERTRGVEPFGDSLESLVHPRLVGGEAPPGGVLGMTEKAFLALVREREFEALRARRLVVMFPASSLEGSDLAPLRRGGSRLAVRLPEPASTAGTRVWRGEARSPDLDVDALSSPLVRARATEAADVSAEPRLAWRPFGESRLHQGTLPCVWVEAGPEPVLYADTGASLAWNLGNRIRRVWFEGGLGAVSEARILEAPEPLPRPGDADGPPLLPTEDGDDWVFARPRTELVEATLQRGRFVLGLLSLADHEYVELMVEPLGPDVLRAPDAAARVASMGGPVAWFLDYRIEGATLARARGRRIGRGGTVEER